MATITANSFSINSLTGTVSAQTGRANIVLNVTPYVLEGNKSFRVVVRKTNPTTGPIVATSSNLTIQDFSSITSVTANVVNVAEGNLVLFSVVMANAYNNANLFYSTIGAGAIAANVTDQDFYNSSNVGKITFAGPGTTNYSIVLRTNTDSSTIVEDGESFKLQLRQSNSSGNVVYVTSNVDIQDIYRVITYNSLTAPSNVYENANATFVLNTFNCPDGTTTVYYNTVQYGNATTALFTSNTGTATIYSNRANLIVQTGEAVPFMEERGTFALEVRLTQNSPVLIAGGNVTVLDSVRLMDVKTVSHNANVNEGNPITFTVTTSGGAPNVTLYYNTSGNANVTSFLEGNTGTFYVINNVGTITLNAANTVPLDQNKVFKLNIKTANAITGNTVFSTPNIFILKGSVFASGGNIYTLGGYTYHVFTTSANLVVSRSGKIDYLTVGGGGASGNPGTGNAGTNPGWTPGPNGQGGCAGGLSWTPASPVSVGTYSVVIGAGGSGPVGVNNPGGSPTSGTAPLYQYDNYTRGAPGSATTFKGTTGGGGQAGGTGMPPYGDPNSGHWGPGCADGIQPYHIEQGHYAAPVPGYGGVYNVPATFMNFGGGGSGAGSGAGTETSINVNPGYAYSGGGLGNVFLQPFELTNPGRGPAMPTSQPYPGAFTNPAQYGPGGPLFNIITTIAGRAWGGIGANVYQVRDLVESNVAVAQINDWWFASGGYGVDGGMPTYNWRGGGGGLPNTGGGGNAPGYGAGGSGIVIVKYRNT